MFDDDDSRLDWAGTTAEVDQTLAALRMAEDEIVEFNRATRAFCHTLVDDAKIGRVQAANIIHGIMLSILFDEDE